MFGTLLFGIRAFFIGLVLGILIAPRPGQETRKILMEKAQVLADSFSDVLALPRSDASAGADGGRGRQGRARPTA